jgi:hypothetical protein
MARRTHWFSMTAVFLWKEDAGKLARYEKRVTICAAETTEEAEAELLKEAKAYAVGNIRFLKIYQIEEIDHPSHQQPTEVAHELVIAFHPDSGSPISRSEFRRQFWGTDRLEDCEPLGFRHAWRKIGSNRSGCYNCRVTRRGRLWEL